MEYFRDINIQKKRYFIWFWNNYDINSFHKCDDQRNINFGYISTSLFLAYGIYILILMIILKYLIKILLRRFKKFILLKSITSLFNTLILSFI